MKKIAALIFLITITSANAATWVGFGNYIPSSDTTYGILSALTPRYVVLRTGSKNFMIEPSLLLAYSNLTNNMNVAGPIDTFNISQTGLGFQVRGLIPVTRSEMLSFYGFAGIGFYVNSYKYTYNQDFGGITKGDYDKETELGFQLPFGLGLQVFLSRNFSLAFDFESGIDFTRFSAEEKRGNTVTDLGSASLFNISLHNQLFRFILLFGKN